MTAQEKVEEVLRRVSGKECKICAQFSGLSAAEFFGWARPVATGSVVATIIGLLLIFNYFEYTLVLFACRVLQIGFAALGALIYSKKVVITTDDVRSSVGAFVENFKPIVVNTCDGIFRILAWEQPGYSVPVLLGTIVVAFLSAYLEDAFIILVLTILAFGGTPLYFKYQKQIDPQVEKVVKEVKKLIGQIPIGKSKTA